MCEEQTSGEATLEETFEQIEEIIRQMEKPDVTLDESFSLYENGIGKLKKCNALLDTVEKKMQVIRENGVLEDF